MLEARFPGVANLSSGALLTKRAQGTDSLAIEIKACLENGDYATDDAMNDILEAEFKSGNIGDKGFVLDGFGRTTAQALLAEKVADVNHVIILEVSDVKLVERAVMCKTDPVTGKLYHMAEDHEELDADPAIKERLVGGADNNDESTVEKRLKLYHEHEERVAAVFDGMKACEVHRIDGDRHPLEVQESICRALMIWMGDGYTLNRLALMATEVAEVVHETKVINIPWSLKGSWQPELPALLIDEEHMYNRAFVFIKPHANTAETKAMLLETFEAKGLQILDQGSIGAEKIDTLQLIDQHYYAIASKATILKPVQLNVPPEKFEAQFGVGWQAALDAGDVYNAMDACAELELDADGLDAEWGKAKAAGKVIKFGGGFYCGLLEVEGKKPIYVFNGFFMQMRSRFTKPGTSISYFIVEWESSTLSWADFRGKLLGPTDPAEAPADSVRGTILAKWQELGLAEEPNVGLNGVHASASPLEGMVEICNWLGKPISKTAFGHELLGAGVAETTVEAWTTDPVVPYGGGRQGSVFDVLEDLDGEACKAKCLALQIAAKPPPPTAKADKLLVLHFNDVYEIKEGRVEPVGVD
jgi:adenylate kinase family enzyme/nucleoside diphosphate kinase